MLVIFFWFYHSYSRKISGISDIAYYFEYTHENYDCKYDLINLTELSIDTYQKSHKRSHQKLFSKKLTLDKITNHLTVFIIQGFVSNNVYNVLKEEKFVSLSLTYNQNGKLVERKMLYEINKNLNGLKFTRGDDDFIMKITMKNLENFFKLPEIITEDKKLKEKLCLLQSIYNFSSTLEKDHNKLSVLIDVWDQDHIITTTRHEGYVISRDKMFFLSINRFIDDLWMTLKPSKAKKQKFIEIKMDDLVEHNFIIQKKVLLITRIINLTYNLKPEQFENLYKELIAKNCYILFKNIIMFPVEAIKKSNITTSNKHDLN